MIALAGAIYDNKNPFLENVLEVTYGAEETKLNNKVDTYKSYLCGRYGKLGGI